MQRTQCEHLGLPLGRHVNLQCFGVAGRLARNAPSVGAALQDVAGFFVLHDGSGSIHVSIHDGAVTLGYGAHVPGLRHADQVYDLAVEAMASVVRQLCGPGWLPDAVLLPRRGHAQRIPRPADQRPAGRLTRLAARWSRKVVRPGVLTAPLPAACERIARWAARASVASGILAHTGARMSRKATPAQLVGAAVLTILAGAPALGAAAGRGIDRSVLPVAEPERPVYREVEVSR